MASAQLLRHTLCLSGECATLASHTLGLVSATLAPHTLCLSGECATLAHTLSDSPAEHFATRPQGAQLAGQHTLVASTQFMHHTFPL